MDAVRALIALVVLVLLVRAARMAWRHRQVSLRVWRAVRPRHVVGSVGLLAVVLSTLLVLLTVVPGAWIGLGSLVGLTGNAVFAPLEGVALRADGSGAAVAAPSPWVVAGVLAFLALLLALLPWLAFVEERVFREGLETATLAGEVTSALRFGLLHLVMLIPIGAALAIAVAGFAYGRLYRRAYARSRARVTWQRPSVAGALPTWTRPSPQQARAEAVLATTVWHATFNSLVVLLVGAGLLVGWLA